MPFINGGAFAEDRARQARGAQHVKRLAVLEAERMAGNAQSAAILTRFRELWRDGMHQWEALKVAQRGVLLRPPVSHTVQRGSE